MFPTYPYMKFNKPNKAIQYFYFCIFTHYHQQKVAFIPRK